MKYHPLYLSGNIERFSQIGKKFPDLQWRLKATTDGPSGGPDQPNSRQWC